MSQFLQFLSTSNAPGILLVVIAGVIISWRKTGWVGEFITALNMLNTPWIAMIVIVLGMIYALKCKQYGIDAASANQVVGAGLGLITGQALSKRGEDANFTQPGASPDPTKENQ